MPVSKSVYDQLLLQSPNPLIEVHIVWDERVGYQGHVPSVWGE